eukprot:6685788-Pyramimonas_sp.AAC.2
MRKNVSKQNTRRRYRHGRGRPVLPAAQCRASCPVDHPRRGPLLWGDDCVATDSPRGDLDATQ